MTEHHKFNLEDKYFLFAPNDLKAYKINKNLYEDLPEVNEEVHDKKLIDILKSVNLIKAPDNLPKTTRIENPAINNSVFSISLNVAQICNMKCIYCYGNKGEYDKKGKMNRETALKSVDFLIKNSGNRKDLSVGFFGGEPLLNFRLIKEIVEYCKKAEEYHNKRIHFNITTNGTLFNEENNLLLRKNNISVTISIDGDKKSQDTNRPLRSGAGSFDFIVPKIKEFFASPGKQAIARVTFTKRSSKIKSLRDNLEDIGFKRMEFVPFSGKKNSNLCITRNQLFDIITSIKYEADDLMQRIKNRLPVYMSSFVEVLLRLMARSKKEYYCGAGRTYTAIAANGKIYPCHRFVGNDKMCMGNIYGLSYSANKKFILDTVDRNIKCQRCWVKYLCGGGCYHDNYENNGEIFKPNPNYCYVFRKKVEFAVSVVEALTSNDKEYFNNSISSM